MMLFPLSWNEARIDMNILHFLGLYFDGDDTKKDDYMNWLEKKIQEFQPHKNEEDLARLHQLIFKYIFYKER